MSLNRENTVWQSKDGSWNIGFNDYNIVGSDPEWDVDYSEKFYWVSSGHATAQGAMDAWDGANPGHHEVVEYDETDPYSVEASERLDDQAAQLYHATQNTYLLREYNNPAKYKGKPKQRSLKIVAKDLAKFYEKVYAENALYVNKQSNNEKRLRGFIDDLSVNASREDLENVSQTFQNSRRKLLDKIKAASSPRLRGPSFGKPRNNDVEKLYFEQMREAAEKMGEVIQNVENSIENNFVKTVDNSRVGDSQSASGGTAGKYHINPETGRPNICRATKQACPFGGSDNHYADKATARQAYEKQNKSFAAPLRKL